MRTVRFHRVQGLVWSSLTNFRSEIPPDLAAELSADARGIAATNLRIAAETLALRSAFEQAGLRILFVKGLTVGALAYSKPMLKMGWDIDVLVDQASVVEAAAILGTLGYRRTIPEPAADLAEWHGRRKESVWEHPSGLFIELHTRLADNHELIPGIDIRSPTQEVRITHDASLTTLADDELFAYLCVHGASSLWFRLKWITDLAALIDSRPASEIERLYARSQELGAYRAAAQALLVADHFYGSLDRTALKPRLLEDRGSRWLAAAAVRQLAGRAEPREPTSTRLGTARIHWTQLLLKPGFRFKFGELRRQVSDAVV